MSSSSSARSTVTVGSRRAVILEHAERIFAEDGYQGAALAGIARAAGLGNAGLIHHFPSKAALYRAVLEDVARDLDTRLGAATADRHDPAARLRAFVQVQVTWAVERPQALRLVQRELLDNRDRVAAARVMPLAGFVTTGLAIVEEAQAAGLLAPGPAEVTLSLIVGSLAYAAVVRPTFRQMLGSGLLRTDEAWLRATAQTILGLLLQDPRRSRSG